MIFTDSILLTQNRGMVKKFVISYSSVITRKNLILLSLREVYRFFCHCEERSDEAIQRRNVHALDCFATLAMTDKMDCRVALAMTGELIATT